MYEYASDLITAVLAERCYLHLATGCCWPGLGAEAGVVAVAEAFASSDVHFVCSVRSSCSSKLERDVAEDKAVRALACGICCGSVVCICAKIVVLRRDRTYLQFVLSGM
jgi:hypothetical protein